MGNKFFWILWPSFLVAAVAEVLFFAVVAPQDLSVFGRPLQLSALAAYTIGFFCFWAIGAASSLATCFFQRRGEDINREAGGRPAAGTDRRHFA